MPVGSTPLVPPAPLSYDYGSFMVSVAPAPRPVLGVAAAVARALQARSSQQQTSTGSPQQPQVSHAPSGGSPRPVDGPGLAVAGAVEGAPGVVAAPAQMHRDPGSWQGGDGDHTQGRQGTGMLSAWGGHGGMQQQQGAGHAAGGASEEVDVAGSEMQGMMENNEDVEAGSSKRMRRSE